MTYLRCEICRYLKLDTEVICPRCVATCRRQLGELVALHRLAGEGMTLLPGNSGRGSRSGERTIGLNTPALDYSQGQDLLDVLNAWKKWVWDEFDLTSEIGPYVRSRASSTYGWEKVLKPPDRLRAQRNEVSTSLGKGSQTPR